jgi:osmotically-inducible protein OsmY
MTADEVRVDVDDGFVVLSGRVHLLAQRMEYDQIAWQTIGVKEVDNEIMVIPAAVTSDSEIERKVRYIMLDTYRRFWHHQLDAQIKVENGRVRIRANLRRPRDLVMLKHRLAKIEGVIELQIDPAKP